MQRVDDKGGQTFVKEKSEDVVAVMTGGLKSYFYFGQIRRCGFDFLEKLASQYPNLSLEWLVTGRGKMYNAGGEDAESLENALPLAPKGQIERIVVFFSDGTFKEFK